MAIFIPVHGLPRVVRPKNDAWFALEELQEFVGGYVQVIRLNETQFLWINEEGKLKGLALNKFATLAAYGIIQPSDYISGDAVLTTITEMEREHDDGFD